MKKIYAANFDLFAPDGAERCKRIYELCVQYGFEPFVPGHYPEADADAPPPTATEIFISNLGHLDAADVVMANLNPYRGYEPDSGTVWEVGYAFAKGKPVFAYVEDMRSMVEKLGAPVDENGFRAEDFGSPLNLMLTNSATVVQGGPEECLQAMVEALK